jgi:TRAP-type C4-dicarboxylate transport system permease small subunit
MAKEAKNKPYKNAKKAKYFDSVVKGLMLFSGLGIFYMLYSKMQLIGVASNELLAPPLTNYWPYAFVIVILLGTVYFVLQAIRKKRGEIPLSFY